MLLVELAVIEDQESRFGHEGSNRPPAFFSLVAASKKHRSALRAWDAAIEAMVATGETPQPIIPHPLAYESDMLFYRVSGLLSDVEIEESEKGLFISDRLSAWLQERVLPHERGSSQDWTPDNVYGYVRRYRFKKAKILPDRGIMASLANLTAGFMSRLLTDREEHSLASELLSRGVLVVCPYRRPIESEVHLLESNKRKPSKSSYKEGGCLLTLLLHDGGESWLKGLEQFSLGCQSVIARAALREAHAEIALLQRMQVALTQAQHVLKTEAAKVDAAVQRVHDVSKRISNDELREKARIARTRSSRLSNQAKFAVDAWHAIHLGGRRVAPKPLSGPEFVNMVVEYFGELREDLPGTDGYGRPAPLPPGTHIEVDDDCRSALVSMNQAVVETVLTEVVLNLMRHRSPGNESPTLHLKVETIERTRGETDSTRYVILDVKNDMDQKIFKEDIREGKRLGLDSLHNASRICGYPAPNINPDNETMEFCTKVFLAKVEGR